MTGTRLIEILMPLEQASILSPREKNVRSGGYISTFHVWPRGGLLRHAEPLSLRHSCPIRAIQRSVQSCSKPSVAT